MYRKLTFSAFLLLFPLIIAFQLSAQTVDSLVKITCTKCDTIYRNMVVKGEYLFYNSSAKKGRFNLLKRNDADSFNGFSYKDIKTIYGFTFGYLEDH